MVVPVLGQICPFGALALWFLWRMDDFWDDAVPNVLLDTRYCYAGLVEIPVCWFLTYLLCRSFEMLDLGSS